MTLLSRFHRQNQIPGGSELERSDFVDKSPHPLSLTITMQASPSQAACISLVAWLTAIGAMPNEMCEATFKNVLERARKIELLLPHQRKVTLTGFTPRSCAAVQACNSVLKMLAGHTNRKIMGKTTERYSRDGVERGRTAVMTKSFITRQLFTWKPLIRH